jgi:ATP-dependent DNA ligase
VDGGNDLPTAIYAELLQEASQELVFKRTLDDPNWVWQEKQNGDRRLVTKEGNAIADFNRKGEPGKGLDPRLIAILRKHPLHRFVIDVEYVGAEDRIYIFDMLIAGDELVVNNPYATRLSYLHAHFDGFNSLAVPIKSVTKREDKIALVKELKAISAEGFCAKDLSAPYRPSNESGTVRYNYKVKFWKDLDAVVIGDSTKVVDGHLRDSVRVGLYMPDGTLKDISGATKKSKYVLKPGDVVKVKYIYGSGTLDIVQPAILELRTDKRPLECTIDQIEVNKNFRAEVARNYPWFKSRTVTL